jgi:hypothetical protein
LIDDAIAVGKDSKGCAWDRECQDGAEADYGGGRHGLLEIRGKRLKTAVDHQAVCNPYPEYAPNSLSLEIRMNGF